MTLGHAQEIFARMVPRLIDKAHEIGFEVRIGHVMRCQDCRAGHKDSLHKLKLAIDLNIFKNGRYLTGTDDHRPLGEYWESLGGTWGGRFFDGNHYSLAYGDMK